MKIAFTKKVGILTISSMLVLVGCQTSGSSKKQEQTSESHTHENEHEHSHAHDEATEKIYEGYFEDNQVKDRSLSDWKGDWQSVYPYLQDGTLDEVFAYKAKHKGKMSAKEYKEYYNEGYQTDVNRIVIQGDT
ncbi:TPA: ZinT/AdcA family metal-binding protein, partial [Bacillus thuringiensis]|nr:ZinT/AdcA family metal-binding protein [Bacillus thuringiensis]